MEFKKREVKNKLSQKNINERMKHLGPNFGGFKEHIEQQLRNHTNQYTQEAVNRFTGKKAESNSGIIGKILIVSLKTEMFELGDINKIDIMSPIKSIKKTFNQETGVREFAYEIAEKDSLKGLLHHWNNSEWITKNNKKIRFLMKTKEEVLA